MKILIGVVLVIATVCLGAEVQKKATKKEESSGWDFQRPTPTRKLDSKKKEPVDDSFFETNAATYPAEAYLCATTPTNKALALGILKAQGKVATTKTILDEYQKNMVRADLNYKGKVLVVEGMVFEIGTVGAETQKQGAPILILDNLVGCVFADGEQQKVATLEKRTKLSIVGICRGWYQLKDAGFVLFEECALPKLSN